MARPLPILSACGALAAFWIAVLPASARVGDDRAAMDARYGAGKEVGNQVLYAAGTAGVFTVTAFFDANAVVTMEIFAHRLGQDGKRPDLAPGEIDGLLKEEGGAVAWQKLDSVETVDTPTWRRFDGQVFARYRPQDQVLIFLNPSKPAVQPVVPPSGGRKIEARRREMSPRRLTAARTGPTFPR